MTGKEFIEVLYQAGPSALKFSELRTRLRWLIEAEVIRKGRPGYGGAGKIDITEREAALIFLSLGAPEARTCPEYVRKIADFRSSDSTLLDVVAEALSISSADGQLPMVGEIWLPNHAGYVPNPRVEWFHDDPKEVAIKVPEEFIDLSPPDFSDKSKGWQLYQGTMNRQIPMPITTAWVKIEGSALRRMGASMRRNAEEAGLATGNA